MAKRLVVTLPPGLGPDAALRFAQDARARGASLLELRTDLYPEGSVDAAALAERVELLVAERGRCCRTTRPGRCRRRWCWRCGGGSGRRRRRW